MDETPALDRRIAASLVGWWLDSGVDVATSDEPRDWLRAAPPVNAPAAPAANLKLPAAEDLAALHAFLATATGLPMERPGAPRILPVGEEGASLMIVADLPGAVEAAEGRPLAGDSWLLAERMLAAIGVPPDKAYIAPLACFPSEGLRAGSDEIARCGEIARDHVRLAKPKRLLVFGDSSARALTGQPLARARGKVHRIEGVRSVATFHPRWLLQRPSDKALAWRDLQLLMDEDD